MQYIYISHALSFNFQRSILFVRFNMRLHFFYLVTAITHEVSIASDALLSHRELGQPKRHIENSLLPLVNNHSPAKRKQKRVKCFNPHKDFTHEKIISQDSDIKNFCQLVASSEPADLGPQEHWIRHHYDLHDGVSQYALQFLWDPKVNPKHNFKIQDCQITFKSLLNHCKQAILFLYYLKCD